MKVDELKAFLRLQGLRMTGKKDELVARAFVAIENNVQVVQTAEQAGVELKRDYENKLKVLDETIPDPLSIKDGLVSEENSVRHWPQTLYPDIFNFLAFHPSNLASSYLNDYKTSKAYNYYAEGWL